MQNHRSPLPLFELHGDGETFFTDSTDNHGVGGLRKQAYFLLFPELCVASFQNFGGCKNPLIIDLVTYSYDHVG